MRAGMGAGRMVAGDGGRGEAAGAEATRGAE